MKTKSKTTILASDSGLDKAVTKHLTRKQIIEKATQDTSPKLSFVERMKQQATKP
jgi:hypothetical protein